MQAVVLTGGSLTKGSSVLYSLLKRFGLEGFFSAKSMRLEARSMSSSASVRAGNLPNVLRAVEAARSRMHTMISRGRAVD
jgi:hypothetical protein